MSCACLSTPQEDPRGKGGQLNKPDSTEQLAIARGSVLDSVQREGSRIAEKELRQIPRDSSSERLRQSHVAAVSGQLGCVSKLAGFARTPRRPQPFTRGLENTPPPPAPEVCSRRVLK